MDCRLEVTLLSVHHHPDILLLGVLKHSDLDLSPPGKTDLENGVQPVDHVPELLLLQGSQSPVIVSGDEGLHGASLQVRHLEGVSQTLGVVNQAGPVEQVNQTEKRNASNDRLALEWSV